MEASGCDSEVDNLPLETECRDEKRRSPPDADLKIITLGFRWFDGIGCAR
jgi:hypothetical protein